MPTQAHEPVIYPSLQEMSPQFPPIDWLWPRWIPRGMLTLLGAAPGVGKSLVALDLARRIIHDRPFPDGAPVPCPGGNVLIVDAEGAPALLNQRARAWDIDRRRLFLLLAPGPASPIDLARQDQQLLLVQMIRDIRPALVVVDSLASATARAETSLQGARAILGVLSTIARQAHLPLLLIHHLRKRPRSGRAASAHTDDLRGSSHISAAARSILALSLVPTAPPSPEALVSPTLSPSKGRAEPSPNPEPVVSHALSKVEGAAEPSPIPGSPNPESPNPGSRSSAPRRLEIIKTNLCHPPPPLALHFEGENVPVPTLRYTEWLEPPPQPRYVDLCARWLLQFLAGGGAPVKPADVVRAAAEAGFPRRTLYRARKALAGRVVDLGSSPRDPHKHWTLAPGPSPSQEVPPSQKGIPGDSGTVAQ